MQEYDEATIWRDGSCGGEIVDGAGMAGDLPQESAIGKLGGSLSWEQASK